MRLLLGLLVLANLRWAAAARERAARLYAEADTAYDESARRLDLAESLAARSRARRAA